MKLRQNKLVPLRLQEHVALDVGARDRFEEILEALDSIRRDWLPQTAHSIQHAQAPQPSQAPQFTSSKPAISDRPLSERGLGPYLADLPQKTLGEYSQTRDQSLLSHVFRIAANFQNQTDRVIFVGDAQSQSVVKSILHACCDPYWNHWTRAERGSKPRRFFAGESWDNDTHQAILEFFSDRRASNRREECDWGVVRLTAPKSSQHEHPEEDLGTDDPVDSFAAIVKKLHAARHIPTAVLRTNADEELWIDCLATGPSACFSKAIGKESTPVIPSSLLAFTFCGLLPAAILGVNVMELLAGAHFISRQFFELDKSSNPVLRWTAWQILAQRSGIERQLYFTNSTLDSCVRWLLELNESRNQLVSRDESTPPCSWARCPPHRYHDGYESKQTRDLWQCHLVVDSVRYDALQVPEGSESNYRDKLHRHIQQKINNLGTSNTSGLIINFPIVDELAIGQWLQWMILADLLHAEMNSTVGKSANSGI